MEAKIKNDEKQRKTPVEQLKSVSKALPSLMRSSKLISKAEKNNLVEKKDFDASLASVKAALAALENSKCAEDAGKLLFEIAGLCNTLDAEAEEILYVENDRFIEKFIE